MIHFYTDECLNNPGYFGALGFMGGLDDIFHENAEKQYREATEYILKNKEYFESDFYIDDIELYSMVHTVLVNLCRDTEYHKVIDINMDLLICLYLYFKLSYARLVSIHKINLDVRAEAAGDAATLYVWMEHNDAIEVVQEMQVNHFNKLPKAEQVTLIDIINNKLKSVVDAFTSYKHWFHEK